MGTKYESSPVEVVLGYVGKIRPEQSEGGKCIVCGDIVHVDHIVSAAKPSTKQIKYRHHGCQS